MRFIASTCVLLLLTQVPVSAAGGGHGGPTPTCRKGCKPLTPEQLRQMRYRCIPLPPAIGRGGQP